MTIHKQLLAKLRAVPIPFPVGQVLVPAAVIYGVGSYLVRRYLATRYIIPAKVENFTNHAVEAMDAAGDDFVDEEERQIVGESVAPTAGVPASADATLMFGSIDAGISLKEAGVATPPMSEGSAKANKAKTARKPQHITVKVALEIKVKLGLLQRSDANMLLLQRCGRKIMEERDMRPSHIATFLPIAVELALIPNRAEVEARQMRATSMALNRDDDVKGTWLSFAKWFDPCQWSWVRRRGLATMPK